MVSKNNKIIVTNNILDIGRIEDFTGKVFNNFTVLSLYGYTYRSSGQKISYWTIQCTCGKLSIKEGLKLRTHVKRGLNFCVECQHDEDLVGKRFNNYQVLSINGREENSPHRLLWNVICNCGETFVKHKYALLKGITNNIKNCKICGPKLRSVPKPPKNIDGKVFNNFKVIRLLPKTKHHYYWEVECTCGHISEKTISQLNTHVERKGFGCKNCSNDKNKNFDGYKKFFDFTGLTIGNYKVLEFAGLDVEKNRTWKVQCKCGAKPKTLKTSELTVIGKTDNPICEYCYRNSFIGKTFNNYMVLDVIEKEVGYEFTIICNNCKNTFTRTLGSLKLHAIKLNTENCIGCNKQFEIGFKIENYTVVEQLGGKQWRNSTAKTINPLYKVRCTCGEEYIKTEERLRTYWYRKNNSCRKCFINKNKE